MEEKYQYVKACESIKEGLEVLSSSREKGEIDIQSSFHLIVINGLDVLQKLSEIKSNTELDVFIVVAKMLCSFAVISTHLNLSPYTISDDVFEKRFKEMEDGLESLESKLELDFNINPSDKHFPEADEWMWWYCTFLGKWEDEQGNKYDLGIYLNDECGHSAAIVNGPIGGDYYSGDITGPSKGTRPYYVETIRRAKILNLID